MFEQPGNHTEAQEPIDQSNDMADQQQQTGEEMTQQEKAILLNWEDPIQKVREEAKQKRAALKKLQRELEEMEEICSKQLSPRSREIKAIAKMVQELSKEYPYPPQTILAMVFESITASPKGKGGPRSPAPPKYANPDNPEQTWTGRGRKPKWVEELLAQGFTLDDIKIPESNETQSV